MARKEIDSRNEEHAYDAFISYSRKDKAFAQSLENALERYKPPKGLDVPQRYPRIFRDETDFTGVDYQQSVEKHLRASARLIVVCSPDARRSLYVNDEIRRFTQLKPSSHIIPVLLAGVPNGEAKRGHEDDMAFPKTLCDAIPIPLAADFRDFDPRRDNVRKARFENAWYTTLANLYSVSRDELEQRDRKRRLKNRRRIVAGTCAIILALVSALIVTQFYWRQAEQERRIARQHDYIGAMELAHQAFQRKDYGRSVNLLNTFLPKPGQEDVRDFFWHFLWRLNHDGNETITDLGAFSAASFSANGRFLASVAGDIVRLWGVESSKMMSVVGKQDSAMSTAVSPDGRFLALGGADGSVGIWDVPTSQMMTRLQGPSIPVSVIAFSPDGRFLATGAGRQGDLHEYPVQIWEVDSRKEVGTLKGHKRSVESIAFSPDSRLCATGGYDGTVRIWDVHKAQQLMTLSADGQVISTAFSPDGRILAGGGYGPNVKLWNVETGRIVASLATGDLYVVSLVFALDGRILAGGGGQTVVKLWDVPSERQLDSLKGHATSVSAVSFSADGRSVVAIGRDGAVKRWGFPKQAGAPVLEARGGEVRSVALSFDGRFMAIGGRDVVMLFEVATGREAAKFESTGLVLSVAFSPDGRLLAGATAHGVINLWDVEEQRLHASLPGHGSSVFSVAFSPDGRLLLTGDGMNVRLWDVKSRQETAILEGHTASVSSVAISGHGEILASGSLDGTVRLWAVQTHREIAALKGQAGSVWSVAFSPDGRFLASGGDDTTVRVWDVTARREIGVLRGHASPVRAVAFSPDGVLASGNGTYNWDNDYALKLWDVRTLREMATLDRQKTPITGVAFAARGRTLLSGTKDGSIKVWFGATEQQVVSQAGKALSAP